MDNGIRPPVDPNGRRGSSESDPHDCTLTPRRVRDLISTGSAFLAWPDNGVLCMGTKKTGNGKMFTRETTSRNIFVSGFAAVLFLIAFCSASFAADLQNVKSAIAARQAGWVAGETSFSRLSAEEKQRRVGLIRPVATGTERVLPLVKAGGMFVSTAPASLDWRSNNGNFVTPIRDQGSCGSCWAFAATAAAEAATLIANNTPGVNLNLSEQVLVSCGDAGGCNGGYPNEAASFIRDTGLPVESCYPYVAQDGTCSTACQNWQNSTTRIQSWNWVSTTSVTVEALKNALYTYGPLSTTMDVYSDFDYYQSGVYTHTTGTLRGGHAVLLVGYSDAGQYFIVKNSWGTGWGDAGYFKIAYSEISSVVEFGYWTIAFVGISAPSCTYSISPGSASFTSSGGLGSLSVTTTGGCSWSTAISDTWLSITAGSSGTGSGVIDYSVSENASKCTRRGLVTVASSVFTATQTTALTGYDTTCSDFNGDGKTDLFWQHQTAGSLYLWYMNGGSYVSSQYIGTVTDTAWKVVAIGDFNRDGNPDVVWQHQTYGHVYIWLMDNNSLLSNRYVMSIADTAWKIVGVADFNNDGYPDLVWQHQSQGHVYIWYMNGTDYQSQQFVMTVTPTTWKIAGVGDFNLDGKPDILWRNTSSGQVALWTMNGVNLVSSAGVATVSSAWDIMGTPDLNGDGKPDILWRNTSSGAVAVWYMNGTVIQSTQGITTVSDLNWKVIGPR
jgi:hypothetical protein